MPEMKCGRPIRGGARTAANEPRFVEEIVGGGPARPIPASIVLREPMRSRANLWSTFERALSLVAIALLLGLPGLRKVPGPYPPGWFVKKFDDTFINLFPGALTAAFALITLAELVVPVLCLVALARGKFRAPTGDDDGPATTADLAFAGASLLLLALTFGSLVAEDYDNAFHDFGYLVGVLFLRGRAFPTRSRRIA